MTDQPVVSVVIPTFNAAATVDRALRSVLGQTMPAWEAILVDDCSTDGTPALLEARAAQEPRIRVVRQPRNGGPGAARNRGLAEARGIWIAFLDADDEWQPGKLARQVALMRAAPRMTISGHDELWLYPDGREEDTRLETAAIPKGADGWKSLLSRAFAHTSSIMAPCDLTRRLGGFDPGLMVGQDQDLFVRLAAEGELGWIPECLATVHNLSEGHMRRNALREATYLLPAMERHVARLAHRLTPAERRAILRARYARTGRNLYSGGARIEGARLLVRAMALGEGAAATLAFLAHESAPGRVLKGVLRSLPGQPA